VRSIFWPTETTMESPKLHELRRQSAAATEAEVLATLAAHPESAKERDPTSNSLPLDTPRVGLRVNDCRLKVNL
jgi:hypothetical protein